MKLNLSETMHLIRALDTLSSYHVARDYGHKDHELLLDKLKDHKLKLQTPWSLIYYWGYTWKQKNHRNQRIYFLNQFARHTTCISMVKTFTETSNKSYDRHTYEVHHSDGRVWKFDDYMQVRQFWFERGDRGEMTVHVKDLRTSGSKGFGWVVTEVCKMFQNGYKNVPSLFYCTLMMLA